MLSVFDNIRSQHVLTQMLLGLGTLSAAAFTLNVLDFFYLYALQPSRLLRYQHGPDGQKASSTQENKAWALVSGASDGIGFCIAGTLASKGFNVVLHGRNPSKLEDKRAQLQKRFPNIAFRFVVADGSESHGMRQRIAEIAAEMASLPGPLTILVNNAAGLPCGPEPPMSTFVNQAATNVDKSLNINMRFPTQLTHELLPLLQRNAPGLVIVIGSGAADILAPYLTVYGSCKHYLQTWTQTLAEEIAVEGHDIEILGVNTGHVAGTSGNTMAPSFTVPNAPDYAKAVLARVGCGRSWVWGYWVHKLLFGTLIGSLPNFILRPVVRQMSKSEKERIAKLGKKDW